MNSDETQFKEKAVILIKNFIWNETLVLLISVILLSSFFITISSCDQLYSIDTSTSRIKESENATEQQKKAENFAIIVVPDTQYYSQYHPEILTNQTQWIADEMVNLNVLFVSSVGDLVQNGDSISEWENVAESMTILDEAGVSWEVLPGNHDFESDGSLSNYNNYFGISNFSGKHWFGGSYPNGTNCNNFALFSGGGYDYLFFSFQYHPSDLVLAWANEIIDKYPNRRVIVATHDYLDLNGNRRHAGNHIWNGFIAPNADQVFLVLSGHMHGEARRVDYVNGYKVHQLVADYQDRPNGGNGWLRILEFFPADNKTFVRTFSPFLKSYESDTDSQFWLDFDRVNSTAPSLTPVPLQSPEPTNKPRLFPLPIPENSPNIIETEFPEQPLVLLAFGVGIAFLAVGLIFFMISGFNRIE